MPTLQDRIVDAAVDALRAHPGGLRYGELKREVLARLGPSANPHTVDGVLCRLPALASGLVSKPGRGVFQLAEYTTLPADTDTAPPASPSEAVPESAFYQPFADWLETEQEETGKAIVVGGNPFNDFWATPDVIGIEQPYGDDVLKGPVVITSAEIKGQPTTRDALEGFGQACAYHLFSHKVWLAVPDRTPRSTLARLMRLCDLFGIGLVTFDADHPEAPGWTILARPARHEPDWYYVNKYFSTIHNKIPAPGHRRPQSGR